MNGARRWFVPETVGTSAMDCGPAALTSLLGGFGIRVAMDRLREACQTDVDGTSIDRVEDVALALGLDAEQIMLAPDLLTLPEAEALPCIVVVRQPDGANHFIVVWRRIGRRVQVMDPAVGRRWMSVDALQRMLYVHGMQVPAAGWRAWATSPGGRRLLAGRLVRMGVPPDAPLAWADEDPGYLRWAALAAAARVVGGLVADGALRRGREALRAVEGLAEGLVEGRVTVPVDAWPALPVDAETVQMRGAVLVRARGLLEGADGGKLLDFDPDGSRNDAPDDSGPIKNATNGMRDGSEMPSGDAATHDAETHGGRGIADPDAVRALKAAVDERGRRPLRAILRQMVSDGCLTPTLIAMGLLVSAAVTVVEATLLRGMVDALDYVGPPEQRLGALAVLAIFFVAALAVELPLTVALLRLGRRIEMRIRLAFRAKLPRLALRYLDSRPLSDMAERAHGIDALRTLPGLAAGVIRAASGLIFTAAALVWLDPALWPIVCVTVAVGLLLPLVSVPLLAERDLRFRTHAGALTKYSLDALLGLSAIRTHGGQRAMRRRHEALLTEWGAAALSLERLALAVEGVLGIFGAAVVGWLLWDHLGRVDDTRGVLLLVWWGLALPGRARGLVDALQAWPGARNQALRILEPLDAREADGAPLDGLPGARGAVRLDLDRVVLRAGSATILDGLDLHVPAGQHVAVVGRSGAGKSSLIGVISGMRSPAAGAVLADGAPLVGPAIPALRARTAWVDPATHIWNQSLLDNLRYGATAADAPGPLLDAAELRGLLGRLPAGLQSPLGEGGGLLSGGEGQRVRLGRAFGRPDAGLVLLDEPFRGLDRPRRRRLLERVRRRWADATVICVTHDLAETAGFDRVVVIDGGRVVEDGPPAELKAAGGLYAELWHTEARLHGIWQDDRWQHRWMDGGRLTAKPAAEVAR